MEKNIITQQFKVSRRKRNLINGHKSFVVWFTGLSGSGKSTLANAVEWELYKLKIKTYSLDGDNVRRGLNRGLGFSKEDRRENLRRIAEVSKLFIDSGTLVLASFISPLEEDRKLVKKIIGPKNCIEIFVNASIEECESRDVKGLYQKARRGEIENFTGISAPYEPPVSPDLEVRTGEEEIEVSAKKIIKYLEDKLEIRSYE